MKYECIIRDNLDLWLTEGNIYDGEPVIPSPLGNESVIKIMKADDGYPAFVRTTQMRRVFDKPDELGV